MKTSPHAPVNTPLTQPPEHLRTMDVARVLGCRYQKARDLMLTGRLGPCTTDEQGKMIVLRAHVLAFDKARREPV